MDEIAPNIFIEKYCYDSYPCHHYLIENNKRKMMSGVSIYNYYIKNKIEVPEHFKEYKDYK